jgi:hypothetical protein
MALPQWLDQNPKLSFEREKQLLLSIQQWATGLGWDPETSAELDFSARQKTDIAMKKGNQSFRVAVLPKSKESQGAIRLQGIPGFKEAEYIWKPRRKKWERNWRSANGALR